MGKVEGIAGQFARKRRFVNIRVHSWLERFADACTVWGDLFNRPDCGFVQSGKKRE
jgi:hypothetical protein